MTEVKPSFKKTNLIELMKKVLWIVLSLVGFTARGQEEKLSGIKPFRIQITTGKTTHLVFPDKIKGVDKGSRDILAQKAKGAENILKVKAAREGFQPTNLTVITVDGRIYSFLVDYNQDPENLTILIGDGQQRPVAAILGPEGRQDLFKELAAAAKNSDPVPSRIKDKKGKVVFRLTGIYVHQDVLLYRLVLNNRSALDYDLESLRFFISDKRRAKRTALQLTEVRPVFSLDDTTQVVSGSAHRMVFVLPKFTLASNQRLSIQTKEQNGARHLELKVSGKAILRARPLGE